jgi:DNA-binding response OmpR family regulator
MKILIVEDDTAISSYIGKGLTEAGFAVDSAFDGEEGLSFINSYTYDLVVMDLMLPKLDGLSIVEKMRSMGKNIPVLILSAKRSVDETVRGLQAGGDDYLVKPFSFSELLARVQVLLRRANVYSRESEPSILCSGGISLNLLTREVKRDGALIELQAKEFSLLEYFLRHPGQVLSKTQILERIWNHQFDPQTNVVDVLVFRLRSKIDKEFETKTIQNIRSVGYVFQPH